MDKFVAPDRVIRLCSADVHLSLLHYKAIAESRLVAAGDILLMVVGLGAMVHYLHYAFQVDGISTEYSYHGEVPVEEIDLRQGQRHDILIMLGHRLGYDYVTLWRFYQWKSIGYCST